MTIEQINQVLSIPFASSQELLDFYRKELPGRVGSYRLDEVGPIMSVGSDEEVEGYLNKRFFFNGKGVVMEGAIDWYAAPEGDLEWNGGFVRQGYFMYLADRYESTGDERYAAAVVEQMLDYIRNVPPYDPEGKPYLEYKKSTWRPFEAAGRAAENWPVALAKIITSNSMMDSYRFMCAKDTKHARKGALLACCLMFIGPLIWFLPDFFVAGNYPDTSTWGLESLGNSIKDATYYMFVSREMPAGMVGLMMGAIFAATMSSMDSALNRNAGIYVRNFHKHFINKDADEEKMLQIGKKATVVFGVAVIVVGLFLNQVQDMGLFNMMMMVNALISFPMWIPGLLGFFVKKTPDWGAWATVVVGGCVSAFVAFIVTPEMIENVLHLSSPLTKHEFSDIKSLALPILLHLCITLPFFLLTQLFYKGHTPERQAEVDLFFNNTCTEVVSKAGVDDELDNRQRSMLGKLIFTLGACTLLLQLVPNSFADHMVFLLVSGIILVIGGLLVLSARKSSKN